MSRRTYEMIRTVADDPKNTILSVVAVTVAILGLCAALA